MHPKDMKIHRREEGDIVVLELDGWLTMGDGDVKLREAMVQELDTGHSKFVLDLHDTEALDSRGLGELVRARKNVQRVGGQLALTRARDKVLDALNSTRLITLFDQFETPEQALAQIASP